MLSQAAYLTRHSSHLLCCTAFACFPDSQAALDHLLSRPDINPHKIVAFGTSLGAAVATALALNNPKKASLISVISRSHYVNVSRVAF